MTWRQSKEFRCRPSELLHIDEELIAYYLDRAVYTFGRAVESDLDAAGQSRGKHKKSEAQVAMARQQVMARWLGTQQYQNPPQRP